MTVDAALQTAVLEDLSSAPNYQRWLAEMAIPYLGARPLELGSGIGDYASIWLAAGIPEIWLTEADPVRLEICRRRFNGDARVSVGDITSALDRERGFTSLVSFNVLEHVEDPVALLASIVPRLGRGAPVLTLVPAFPFAMSKFDRQIGHVRRYTKESLAAHLSGAGLAVETLKYVNMPGLLAWTLGMRLLGLSPSDGPYAKWWDRIVVPATRRLERGKSLPFGQSLWSVARVRACG